MWVGPDAAPAAGRERFSRTRAAPGAPPGGHYEPPARSMATGGRPPAMRFAAKREGRREKRTAPVKRGPAL